MPYVEASQKLNSGERKVIARGLIAWRKHGASAAQLARNFVHEEQLDVLAHEAFLRQLATRWASSPDDALYVLAVYIDECRNFHLRGPVVGGPEVQFAGRAATYRGFKVHIEKAFARAGVPISAAALEIELRALAANCIMYPGLAASFTSSLFGDLPIAGHPTWCAFVNPNRLTTPFVPHCETAEEICDAFGLGMIDPPEELATFTYRPPEPVRTPTIADAGDYHFFRPSPPGSPHGWTKPLGRVLPVGEPRPEAVHQQLCGNAIDLSFKTTL